MAFEKLEAWSLIYWALIAPVTRFPFSSSRCSKDSRKISERWKVCLENNIPNCFHLERVERRLGVVQADIIRKKEYWLRVVNDWILFQAIACIILKRSSLFILKERNQSESPIKLRLIESWETLMQLPLERFFDNSISSARSLTSIKRYTCARWGWCCQRF